MCMFATKSTIPIYSGFFNVEVLRSMLQDRSARSMSIKENALRELRRYNVEL